MLAMAIREINEREYRSLIQWTEPNLYDGMRARWKDIRLVEFGAPNGRAMLSKAFR